MNNQTSKVLTATAAFLFIIFFLFLPMITTPYGHGLTGKDIIEVMDKGDDTIMWPIFFLVVPVIVIVFRLLLNVTDSQTKRLALAGSLLMTVPFISLLTWKEWSTKMAGPAFFLCMVLAAVIIITSCLTFPPAEAQPGRMAQGGVLFCTHCGERIAGDAEQRFCMSCGKPLDMGTFAYMPRAVVQPTPHNNPQWWQKTAAWIFLFALIGHVILVRFFPEYFFYDPYFEWNLGLQRFWPLLMGIGIAFLLHGCKNTATMTALIIWLVGDVLETASHFLPRITNESQEWLLRAVFIAISLSSLYAYSLVAQNNKMTASSRTWLNLLAANMSISLFWNTQFLWFDMVHYNYFFSFISAFQFYVIVPLNGCSWWVLARSETFGGPCDERKRCNYTPLNKYMAMGLIAPAIMILAVWLVDKIS